MQYNKLGNTDLDVSLICLGSMTWGEQNTEAEGFAQMDMARAAGINFFDAAEMYPIPPRPETQGATERIMGNWLKQRGARDKLVIATKVTGRASRNAGFAHIRGGPRLSGDHIVQAVEASLQRLQTDYIDLYQVHWPERATNFFGQLEYSHQPEDDGVAIEQTLCALATLVEQGKVRYLGISNETPWGMMEYLRLAERCALPKIVAIQNPYNLLNRSFDIGASEIALREQLSLLAYSPLAFGVLSGKYLGGARPEGARLSRYQRFTRYFKTNAEPATEAYVALAREHGLSPAQMALAWVNQRRCVTANIIGATTPAQLQENIDSAELRLSEAILAGIDAIHARYPNPTP